MNIRDWQTVVHELACSKGWHPDLVVDANRIGALLALVHSEVSEALEAVRSNDMDLHHSESGKPEGLPSELADVVIRVMDMCGLLGIDLEHAIKVKHAYNSKRPVRHGGKAL